MTRIILVALLVTLVVCAVNSTSQPAPDTLCSVPKDCPCGSVCNGGICLEGCMAYDTFLASGSEATVYGRNCRCGTVPDERGMVLECEEGVDFVGAPEGVDSWQYNPSCEQPALSTMLS